MPSSICRVLGTQHIPDELPNVLPRSTIFEVVPSVFSECARVGALVRNKVGARVRVTDGVGLVRCPLGISKNTTKSTKKLEKSETYLVINLVCFVC